MMPQNTTARARARHSALTTPEARLWAGLRRLRGDGFHFRRQAPFRGYFLDFVCYTHHLVVEVDGAQHGESERACPNTIRDAVLEREGFRTRYFAASDVLGKRDGVVTASRLALPPPGASRHPPHKGEGEGRR